MKIRRVTSRTVQYFMLSVISLLAQPTQPRFVCRMLVKMGVEFVAANEGPAVYESSLDAARRVARYGTKQAAWWYVMHTNVESVRASIEVGTFSAPRMTGSR